MRRATITLPDELEAELEDWLATQPTPPSLTGILQTALRTFLREKKLEALQYRPRTRPLSVTPSPHGSGHQDTSIHHDAVLTEPFDGSKDEPP